MTRALFLALLGLSCATISAPAMAQSPLTPVSVLVQRYDEIVSSDGDAGVLCCAPHILASGPGADFYHVRMVFDVGFSDSLDRVSINSNDITLLWTGATEAVRAIGRYDYVGIFTGGSPSIFARRPRDWPAETEQAFIDAVWQVPDGVTAATLQIGEEGAQLQIPIDLNVAQTQPITPGQTMQAVVTGFAAEDALNVVDRISGQEVAGRVVPRTGRALRLDLSVTPLMSTATDAQAGENRFFMNAQHFALLGPEGLPMPFMGYRSDETLRTRWSISSNWDSQPRTSSLTLYYLGAPGAGLYTVYYMQDAVAQFTLQ
jgi:hypothetical protein